MQALAENRVAFPGGFGDRFRQREGFTEHRSGKKWAFGMNFTLNVTRMVKGSKDHKSAGVMVELTSPSLPGEVFTGCLPSLHLYRSDRLLSAIQAAIPTTVGLVVNMSPAMLNEYWAAKYMEYVNNFKELYGYTNAYVTAVGAIGWQGNGHFVVNPDVQLDSHGRSIPKQQQNFVILEEDLGGIPLPTITNNDTQSVSQLFNRLKELLPKDTYMMAVMMGGVALQAMHYPHVKKIFHQVPIPVLLGQPHTYKSFISKVCSSLLGLHRNAIYTDLTMAKMSELLGRSIFFVYNDPEKSDVLKKLITKSFEDGITSSCLRELEAGTSPLLTGNAFVMRSLHNHGMRELSRLVVLPLTTEASGSLPGDIDNLLDRAVGGLGKMVALGQELRGVVPRVEEVSEKLMELLEGDSAGRLASNYAMLITFTELFIEAFALGVERDELWECVKNIIIPRGIVAHQLSQSVDEEGNVFLSALGMAWELLPHEEFFRIARPTSNKGVTVLGVRIQQLRKTINERQTQKKYTDTGIKAAMESMGITGNAKLRFGSSVLSGKVVEEKCLPPTLWDSILEAYKETEAKKTGRPVIVKIDKGEGGEQQNLGVGMNVGKEQEEREIGEELEANRVVDVVTAMSDVRIGGSEDGDEEEKDCGEAVEIQQGPEERETRDELEMRVEGSEDGNQEEKDCEETVQIQQEERGSIAVVMEEVRAEEVVEPEHDVQIGSLFNRRPFMNGLGVQCSSEITQDDITKTIDLVRQRNSKGRKGNDKEMPLDHPKGETSIATEESAKKKKNGGSKKKTVNVKGSEGKECRKCGKEGRNKWWVSCKECGGKFHGRCVLTKRNPVSEKNWICENHGKC